MEEHYSIKEISDLFNIPKSTLRYWDAEKLIQIERNPANGYRIYTETQLIELTDIQFYRSLNVPIQQLKKITTFDASSLSGVLMETELSVTNEIERLRNVQLGIRTRLKKIELVKYLQKQLYQDSQPDFDFMIHLDIADKESVTTYLADPSSFLLKINSASNSEIEYGIASTNQKNQDVLWQKSKETKCFKECLLKVSIQEPAIHNLQEHLNALTSLGYTTGHTVARYLVSFAEEERFDYYHAWIEVR
ncbi:hypothetical protein CKN86_08705 [Carnobacterium divergens]|uniref:MerR family transcriptional regulator n=1 Tax=Carnobacterium divergens TaxID=2748 RepID=UPI000D3FAA9F|nr:MerR family transcriptional regulator [Carnobacterium divergens]MCO6018104.1 MerR family transcriptional regulator [Carnobacterium divergens]TFI61924.1 hypothetical protein CKN62_08845 [Carnobacterium divergens]TFI89196.1 hypothetical protein CKN84_08735 [Carnobacterium divergens]TFJ03349.1 hypothetical protein CKN86_08705 [Carnobacterium divergens]TFJ05510.1 hypothetical protein CKN65_08745 [Carnobacterium divergens]